MPYNTIKSLILKGDLMSYVLKSMVKLDQEIHGFTRDTLNNAQSIVLPWQNFKFVSEQCFSLEDFKIDEDEKFFPLVLNIPEFYSLTKRPEICHYYSLGMMSVYGGTKKAWMTLNSPLPPTPTQCPQ